MAAAAVCQGAEKPRKGKGVASYAVISGTVFRDSGFALLGAEVTLSADPDGRNQSKFKKVKLISDSRGEFAFRVPASPAKYAVRAEAKGYRTAVKTVAVQGEEQIEVSFQLSPSSN